MSQLVEQGQAEAEDVFRLSKDNLIVVVFAKTNSPYFALVVNIAKGASAYVETKLDKTSLHTCVFGRSPEQAARAISLLRYVESWTTKQLFVAGRLVTGDVHSVMATLECYQSACHCTNPDANCLIVTDDIFMRDKQYPIATMMTIRIAMPEDGEPPEENAVKATRYVMPCQRAFRYDKIERNHPASWKDQVQAIAVQRDVDWCPCFDLSKFRQYD